MSSPVFDLFEILADELAEIDSRVITRKALLSNEDHAPVLDELKKDLGKGTTELAIAEAIRWLSKHFADRGAELPFSYDATTGRFTAIDLAYLAFVQEMRAIRSLGKRSRDFELAVLRRLELRITGALHRVGHPRDLYKSVGQINEYLRSVGFQGTVLRGREKDGGLDILWFLPLGAYRYRPIVSVQCKNGLFDMADANNSKELGGRSLDEYRGLKADIHVPCVVFNDYLTPQTFGSKAMNFVPLGLTDLAAPRNSAVEITLC